MKRSWITGLIGTVLALGGVAFVYVFWFAGGSGEPSTELTTPELVAATTTVDGGTTTSDSSGTTAGGTAFVIDSEQSSVSFEIDEVLRGESQTVLGTTDQVAGQVVVELADLGVSQFSEIVINARTFTTDSDQRNRAIRGPVILDSGSDEHELITFTPTSIEGLDGVDAAAGGSYEFTVTGDLIIRDTTNSVTFDVMVDLVDEATLEGSATTVVLRNDYGIGIPSVPFVADVADEVTLLLDFVAVAG